MNSFFRPQWTSGRYDFQTHSAILFNLLEGKSYFFEDISADVIGELLKYHRGDKINACDFAKQLGIAEESIFSFFNVLSDKGLLSTVEINSDIIDKYRELIVMQRNSRSIEYQNYSSSEFLLSNTSTAEKSYANRTHCPVATVLMELTYNCSEGCIHCYNPGATRNNTEVNKRSISGALTKEDYFRIIDELHDEGAVRVCLSGGDPFSNPYAWDIIDYLYQKEIAIEIFTNAQKLVGKEELLASYFPCVVGISVYSSVPEIHDTITRVKGSFEKTYSVLRNLAKLGQVLEVKCCIMQQNLKSYLGVKDIARQCNATFQMESAIFDSSDGDKSISKYLRLTEKQLEVVLRDTDNPLYVGQELNEYGYEPKDMNDVACKACISGIAVAPDGTLIPCASFHASLGNLKDRSLHDLLYDNLNVKWWTTQLLSNYEECGKHDYCGFCKICPGLNFAEHGTPLKAAENNCFVAKVRYNLANKLSKGQDPLAGKSLGEAIEQLDIKVVGGAIHRELSVNNHNKNIF